MEFRKQNIMHLINMTKKEIEIIKKSSTENKKTIEEINSLKGKLTQIEDELKPKQQDIKRQITSLDLILKQLSDIKLDIELSMEENMFNVIEKNLLDGMKLDILEGNRGIRLITFEGEKVGDIEVLENCETGIKIKVRIYNSSNEFIVQDPFRMYSIITFINTKFNYKKD